ncbi:MAG: hypothetical protein EOP04_30405, partial [Proteobacteria bacterium]
EYTLTGKLKRSSRPYFEGETVIWNTLEYDALDRVTRSIDADNAVLETSRDALTITLTDPRKHTTVKRADALGNVVQIVNEKGETLDFDFDAAGRLHAVTDSKGNVTQQEFDILDRRISLKDPNTGLNKTFYNGLNLPYRIEDAMGNVTLFFYDILGRKIRQEINANGESVVDKWHYDRDSKTLGILYSIEGSGFKEIYSFDKFNRRSLTETTIDGRTFVEGQTYDSRGRLKASLFASGLSIDNVYDEFTSTLISVKRTGKDKVYWNLVDAFADGQTKETTLGNGVNNRTVVNPKNGSIENSVTTDARGEILESRAYTYDLKGNVTSREDRLRNRSEIVTYDVLDRIETITDEKGKAVRVAYDELGNIR